ncbi:MAG: hypothetical protein AAGD96_28200 [Chloroflexota bacterium]
MTQVSEKELARLFILAWWDSVQEMGRLVPLIAETINTTPENIFYERHLNFDFVFPRKIEGTKWRCMFHGIGDCAVTHEEDGRHLEIPFGLNSRYDHFSGWGTLLYIMSSKAPWPNYVELKSFLADKPPPYERWSGSHEKMMSLTQKIDQLPLFRQADQIMTNHRDELVKKHSYTDENGTFIRSYGNEDGEFNFKQFFEFSVCDWIVLNEVGQQIVESGCSKKDFYQLWNEAGLE